MSNKRTDVDVTVVLEKRVLSNVNSTERSTSAQMPMVKNNLHNGLISWSISLMMMRKKLQTFLCDHVTTKHLHS